jgi:hypothetical protein
MKAGHQEGAAFMAFFVSIEWPGVKKIAIQAEKRRQSKKLPFKREGREPPLASIPCPERVIILSSSPF